jgi:GxxExxY protein
MGEADKRMGAIPHTDLTYRIIGCAMKVHRSLGPGLKEGIYQRALAIEMTAAGLTHEEERPVEIHHNNALVGILYLDHLVADCVVVEIKALRHKLTNDEVGQVITYLAATGYPVGLLLNFAGTSLEYRRILRPMKLNQWQDRIARYVWRPKTP